MKDAQNRHCLNFLDYALDRLIQREMDGWTDR